jgi:ProP effector
MKRENASEKPLVIVRKKVGKGSTPAGSTKTVPRGAPPAPKTTAPAPTPEPAVPPPPAPAQPQPPETAPQLQSTAEAALSKTAERKRRRSEVLEILHTRWPGTFPRDFSQIRPWAIGIAKDVARLLPEQPPLSVKDAISLYRLLATPSYCHALFQGGPRYDLDGNACGEVTPEDQERARQDLKVFYDRRKKRRVARAQAAGKGSPQGPDEVPGQGPGDSPSVINTVDVETE